jgi:hypothetical protein
MYAFNNEPNIGRKTKPVNKARVLGNAMGLNSQAIIEELQRKVPDITNIQTTTAKTLRRRVEIMTNYLYINK